MTPEIIYTHIKSFIDSNFERGKVHTQSQVGDIIENELVSMKKDNRIFDYGVRYDNDNNNINCLIMSMENYPIAFRLHVYKILKEVGLKYFEIREQLNNRRDKFPLD